MSFYYCVGSFLVVIAVLLQLASISNGYHVKYQHHRRNTYPISTISSGRQTRAAYHKCHLLPPSSSTASSTLHSSSGSSSDASSDKKQVASLDFSQIKPFLQIAVPFFKEDKKARDSILGVIALTLINSGVSVAFSYVNRDFYNALNERNEVDFYQKVQLFFGFLCIAVPLNVAYRFYREKLSLYWREALTLKVLDQYCLNRTFYQLEVLQDPNYDNPDQRIAEDIRSFTRTSLDFTITIISSIIDLVSFSAVLFQIYPGLFVAIIAYAGAGSLITTKLGQSLVGLNYERLTNEANFRFNLIRTRENAESIAFYDSSAKSELNDLVIKLNAILSTQSNIITVQRNLEVFTTSYRYLVQILPSLIIAPLYFAKKVELGTITQSYGAFNHILGDFSIIINQFEALSAFSAGLTRLNNFLEKIDSTSIASTNANGLALPQIKLQSTPLTAPSSVVLSCVDLTVLTPDGKRTLIGGNAPEGWSESTTEGVVSTNNGVNIEINVGDRVLIEGPSGGGKSSFLRVIAGLWTVGDGTITWTSPSVTSSSVTSSSGSSSNNSSTISSSPSDVFFLPQRPYNLLSSLRDQVMYPKVNVTGDSPSDTHGIDARILEILKTVKLGDLSARMSGSGNALDGLNSSRDWSKVLSLGEQQRLAFARVIYNVPAVIILDEATSALDIPTELLMYECLNKLNVTYISVGHRSTLRKFHNKRLQFSGPYLEAVMDTLPSATADPIQAAAAVVGNK